MVKLLSILLCFFLFSCNAQQAHQLTTLSEEVKETSGLLIWEGAFYTFNDSGGEPELYQLDTLSGEVLRTLPVKGAKNKDWEAITTDGKYIYIGDIGNNMGGRKDLVIYKCPIEGLKSGALNAEEIEISYEDQDDFKHKGHDHEFDGEGLFVRNDKLYLISKNWEKDESKIYEVPTKPGEYELEEEEKIDVFGKVTDAFFSEKHNSLFLIGYGKFPFITYLKDFDGNHASLEVTLPVTSPNGFQTEGISVSGGRIYYTSEQVDIFEAELARYFVSDFAQLIKVYLKGSTIKVSAQVKMKEIIIEKKKGKNLLELEDLNARSKSIPVWSFDDEDEVYVKIKLENGAECRQRISLKD
ncbi:SdiA-regulated domain-containing protein [Parvicella tangerina]|nr:SdiA-regulated domain-containing protein [Parvicella tangerina]